MEITGYNLQSTAFRPVDAHKYELSILTGMDSFSYVVRDRSTNTILAHYGWSAAETTPKQIEETLNKLGGENRKLGLPDYGSVVHGWGTDRMALVPRELYDATKQRSYLEHLTLVGLGDAILEEWYNELDAHLLYTVKTERLNAVTQKFKALRNRHVAGGLLTAWRLRALRKQEVAVSVNFRGNTLFVAAHRSGVLQFSNTFTYASAQDALYFILLTYETSGMLPDRCPLYLSGEILTSSAIYQLLYTYVREISFSTNAIGSKLAPGLADLPRHLYYDLLCLS